MTQEKKKTIILTIGLAIVCLVLIGVFVFNELKVNGIILDKETKEIMKSFDKYYNSKERTVIFYGSSECGYCELQEPVIETIAEDYGMDYLKLDSIKLPNKQRKEIVEKLEIEGKTPTLVIVQDGEVIDIALGYTDGQDSIEFFSSNELIPEDAVYSPEANITFINYDKYEDLIEADDTQVIVVGQTTCGHCISFKPALNAVAGDYDVTINYLNLTKMTEEEYNDFKETLSEIEYNDPDFIESGSFGTPLTLIIEDGKVIDYISGQRTKSQLVRELKKANLISE